jgi:pimeloyl-[acyl-carrier protein] methyl ester esterase
MKKPSIVLLHGWGFSRLIWETFIPYLENDFDVTCLDLLGYGDNITTTQVTLEKISQDVIDKLPTSPILLGWSLGGLVAMHIAAHHPERLSHLITITSTPRFMATTGWPGMSVTTMDRFCADLIKDHQQLLQHFIYLQFHDALKDRQHIKALKKHLKDSVSPSPTVLNDTLSILKNTDLRSQMKTIQCPQQYLFGRLDTIVPARVSDKIKLLAPNAKVSVLPKVSHAPFLSDPQRCYQHIMAGLR